MTILELVEKKNVLELGAGIGLTGIIISKLLETKVLMTDYLDIAIDNINYNIEISICIRIFNTLDNASLCKADLLDWTYPSIKDDINFDYILAADCVKLLRITFLDI